jgi:hypothetical protein
MYFFEKITHFNNLSSRTEGKLRLSTSFQRGNRKIKQARSIWKLKVYCLKQN